MVDLPEEVVEEILSRLPVESLVRFKCVCKFWYALFNNQKFVSRHMAKQSKDDAIVVGWYQGEDCVTSFLSNLGDGGESGFFIKDLDSGSELPCFLKMHGHCNGIIALSSLDKVIICNPAIREFRILPKSSFQDHIVGNVTTIDVGFGYDPKTNDYKVVRIFDFCEDENPSPFVSPLKAEVFSLRASSIWRKIKNVDVGVRLWQSEDDMEQYFDGVYHWKADDLITNKLMLVSFDMANEIFSKMPLPDICQSRVGLERSGFLNMIQLGVYNNKSIAVFVHPRLEFTTCMEVWAKKEFGLKEYWTKQLTIGPILRFERPLVFWKNDKEFLYEDLRCERLISYNLTTLKPKTITFYWGIVNTATTYMKTLVSVNKREDIAT